MTLLSDYEAHPVDLSRWAPGAVQALTEEGLAALRSQMPFDQTGLTGRFNYVLDINSYITDEVRKSQGPGGGPPPRFRYTST